MSIVSHRSTGKYQQQPLSPLLIGANGNDAPPVRARTYPPNVMSQSDGLEMRLVMRVISIAFLISVAIGVGMAWALYLRTYDPTFSMLNAKDLTLSQGLYNETVARTTKDMALMQEQARLQGLVDTDTQTRIEIHAFINATRINDTEARITGDALIAERLANETPVRIAADLELHAQIDNATGVLVGLKEFDQYSLEQCAIKMANISDITEDLINETDTRIAKDMLLMDQDVAITNALVTLVNQLHAEIANRTDKDMLLMSQLALITENLIRTMNNQFPVAGYINFTHVNPPRVNVSNGVLPNEIFVTAFGVLTINGVTADGAGNLQLIPGPGTGLDYPSPNLIRIFSAAGTPPPQNRVHLGAVYPYGSETCWVQSQFYGPGGSEQWYCAPDARNGVVKISPHLPCQFFDGQMGNVCTMDSECNVGGVCVSGRCHCDSCISVGPAGNTQCQTALGSQWTCQQETYGKRCRHTGGCWTGSFNDESQCNAVLGEPWHCRNNFCVREFCQFNVECRETPGMGPDWFCVNNRCTRAPINGENLPVWPGNDYLRISQPHTSGSRPGCNGCTFPEFGWQNGNTPSGREPLVIGNRPIPGMPPFCPFQPWEAQLCGFIVPNALGTWTVQIGITIKARFLDIGHYPRCWWKMHIDRGAGWEETDIDHATSRFQGFNEYNFYVTMSSTLIVSTAMPGGYTPGTPVYAGWSAYWEHSGETNNDVFATWYHITYDITRTV